MERELITWPFAAVMIGMMVVVGGFVLGMNWLMVCQ